MTQQQNIIGRLAGVASAALIFGVATPAIAVDSASAEFATGNKTQMARLGVQWNWEKRWWESGGRHLGGYWDLTLAQWRGSRFENRDATQNITDIGITPVFRYGADSGKGLYGELGIGAHLLSDLYDNNGRRLSTRFEFGDHIGAGYVFTNGLDLGVKFQHFSNGGIKQPNNGVNFGVVRIAYPF
ncbi:acyloxyacyl hydrolase [Oxalobacteraceae bacterium OM1]|nr:acyloxyacyl hydrolase [Oxalobacteraceae bacterium OM1]